MKREEAKEAIASFVAIRDSATDAVASDNIAAFRTLHNNKKEVLAGTRINWNGQLYRAAVTLFDNEQSTPDVAPTLWEKVMYKDGIRIIPETITAGLKFSKGEQGWWTDDKIYASTIGNNTWTPAQSPQFWKLVTK